MGKLTEETWFNEQWATEVCDATRELVRLYCDALEAVSEFPGFFGRVRLYGIRTGYRPLLVLKSLLREAAVDHIRAILEDVGLLHLRAFAAARPLPAEMRLGVKRTADAATIAEAEMRRSKFIARQQHVAALLKEAAEDAHELAELIAKEEKVGQRALKSIIRLFRRGLPFLWAGWVITQFQRFSNAPQLQLFLFFAGIILIYHLTALATLLFHDAAERKDILFNGYIGKASDGLDPLFPEASRLETALFKKFHVHPPIVISWETVIPILHYVLISAIIVWLWVKLPLAPVSRWFAGAVGFVLVVSYLKELVSLAKLLTLRYPGRSNWEIMRALFPWFQSLVPLAEKDQQEGSE